MLLETGKLLTFFHLYFEKVPATESCVKPEIMATREQGRFQSHMLHLPSMTIQHICLRYKVRGS